MKKKQNKSISVKTGSLFSIVSIFYHKIKQKKTTKWLSFHWFFLFQEDESNNYADGALHDEPTFCSAIIMYVLTF